MWSADKLERKITEHFPQRTVRPSGYTNRVIAVVAGCLKERTVSYDDGWVRIDGVVIVRDGKLNETERSRQLCKELDQLRIVLNRRISRKFLVKALLYLAKPLETDPV